MKIGKVTQMSVTQIENGITVIGDKNTITTKSDSLALQRAEEPIHSTPEQCENVFIVHGHDEKAIYELKDYLQNTLQFPEPTVLSNVAGKGRTVIEAFEEEAAQTSLVFVLVTPDDTQGDGQLRARQNVIFELGYFLGRLGRLSGRTIILLRGNVELPSDISGMLYIRFDHGILAAGEDIRRAVNAVRESG